MKKAEMVERIIDSKVATKDYLDKIGIEASYAYVIENGNKLIEQVTDSDNEIILESTIIDNMSQTEVKQVVEFIRDSKQVLEFA